MNEYKNVNVLECENFFKDPYEVKNVAISNLSSFHEDPNGIWPGKRFFDVPEGIMKESLIKSRKIFNNPNLNIYNCCFHLTGKKYSNRGWCHYDSTYAKYSSIIYLNEISPKDSGTLIYDNYRNYKFLDDIIEEFSPKRKSFLLKEKKSFLDRFFFDIEVKKYNKKFFNPNVKVKNEFNKFVGFDSSLIHTSENHFGTRDEKSRLCFVSFLI